MQELQRRMLQRFYSEAERLSRNRNFHAHQDPTVRRMACAGRLLQSLRHDLLHRDLTRLTVRRVPQGDHVAILLELEWEGGRRRSFLTEVELAVMCEDEQIEEQIGQLREGCDT
jgi:hypothetical protein